MHLHYAPNMPLPIWQRNVKQIMWINIEVSISFLFIYFIFESLEVSFYQIINKVKAKL